MNPLKKNTNYRLIYKQREKMKILKKINSQNQLNEKQWNEWNATIFRLIWKIWLVILLVELLLFFFFDETETISNAKYISMFIIRPSGLLAIITGAIQLIFTKLFKTRNRRIVSLYTIVLLTAYAGVTVCVHTSIRMLLALLLIPMILTPLYKDKLMTFVQAILVIALYGASSFYFIPMTGNILPDNPYSELIEFIVFAGATLATYIVLERVNSTLVLTDELSRHDSLTHLYNHENFYEELDSRRSDFAKNQLPFSVIIADIDNFKKVNDTYGHAFGDEVIRCVGELFMKHCKSNDFCARYGGEEFSMIISNDHPMETAEAIRKEFENLSFKTPSGTQHFTISVGASIYDKEYESSILFFEQADAALYESKRTGKNKVVIHKCET